MRTFASHKAEAFFFRRKGRKDGECSMKWVPLRKSGGAIASVKGLELISGPRIARCLLASEVNSAVFSLFF